MSLPTYRRYINKCIYLSIYLSIVYECVLSVSEPEVMFKRSATSPRSSVSWRSRPFQRALRGLTSTAQSHNFSLQIATRITRTSLSPTHWTGDRLIGAASGETDATNYTTMTNDDDDDDDDDGSTQRRSAGLDGRHGMRACSALRIYQRQPARTTDDWLTDNDR